MREIMKKILFATTALVATAGVAAADVAVSGSAEFGIFQNENASGDGSTGDLTKTRVFTDYNIRFSMSGEADNGLTFGATVDLDEVNDGGGNADMQDAARSPDATITMSFGGLSLTVGDTDSAFDARLTEVAVGSAINDDHTVHPGYNGNSLFDEPYGGQEIRVDYSFGDVTVSASMSPDRNATDFDTAFAIGVSYAADLGGIDLGLGLGYITTDEASAAGPATYDDALGVSIAAGFGGGFDAILNYSILTDDSAGAADDASHIAIGVGYTMNALTIGANYGSYDYDDAFANDNDGYGLTVNYDLGGGLEVQFGYGAGELETGTYEDTYSFGVAMSF
jgi:outer membrane protein OmpU